MKQKINKRAEYWQEQIRRAAEHHGGVSSFCEANGIRRPAFYYWKKRLRPGSAPGPKAFSKVEIISPAVVGTTMERMPNPKWLAEFLVALGQAGGMR